MKEPSVLQPPRGGRLEAVQFLAEENAKDMASREPNLSFVVPLWFRQLQIFQGLEDERLIGGAATGLEQQGHKRALAMLIWQGETLVNLLREQGFTEQAGVTLPDVEASLEGLYDKQRVFYGGMTEARRAQVLSEVFGAS